MMEIIYLDERLKQYKFEPSSSHAAGYDLRACIQEPTHLAPGETKMINTGIQINMLHGYEEDVAILPCALILPRSGLGCKGVRPRNAPGLVDADYLGEIKLCMYNGSDDYFKIEPMDRIAQMMFTVSLRPEFDRVEEFSVTTERGGNGFGSTGHK